MADASISFEPGSGRFDRDAEIFTSDAADAQGRVLCAISHEAFEALSGIIHLDPASADVVFMSWEDDVFDIARAKYAAGDRQNGGAVVIRASDIEAR